MAKLILKQIERGAVIFPTSGTSATVTLATALTGDTSKAILLFSSMCNSTSPVDFSITGKIISTTQINFVRQSTPGVAATVEYQVIEFTQGISVQHLDITQTANTVNTTITGVNLQKSFVILSNNKSGSTYGADDMVYGDLTTSANLATVAGATSTTYSNVGVQVVTIDDATVQKISTTYGTSATKNITVTTIDPTKTFWFFGLSTAGTITMDEIPYLEYVNSTTLRFNRVKLSGADDFNILAYVVSLSAGVTVQNVTTTIASSGITVSPTITSVVVNNTTLYINGYNQNYASTNLNDDSAGYNNFTLSGLTSTAFTATRAASPAVAATTNVQVLEFVKVTTEGITSYTEDTSVINNPERGLYKYTTQTSGYSITSGTNNLSVSYLSGLKIGSDKVNVIYRYYLIPEFLSASINSTFLNNIQTDFNNIRTAGLKALVRFAYSDTEDLTDTIPQQPTKAQILSHIGQLSAVISSNQDVILSYQAGFIGTWGEGYYTNSTEFGTEGSVTSGQKLNRKEVIDEMLSSTPSGVQIQVRYPWIKRDLYGTIGLDETTSYQNTAVARIGFFNDAFLNNWGDQGMYSVSAECVNPVGNTFYNYVANETKYTLMTGETNGLNPCISGYRTSASNAIYEMNLLHWTVINRDYHPSFWGGIGGADYATIQKRLGYRFVLNYISAAVSGSNINININLQNSGFARVVKERPVYLLLKNTTTSAITQVSLNTDVRTWVSGVSITQNIDTTLSGNYGLYLWLPDKQTILQSNPDYSIRMANSGVWEASTGYNNLLTTVNLNYTSISSWFLLAYKNELYNFQNINGMR